MDPTARLQRVFEEVQAIVDGVTPEQMDAPTPCREWDVRALLNHLTGAVVMFGHALTGVGSASSDGDVTGNDPAEMFRQATRTTLGAWKQPGALERTLALPMGEVPGAFAININLMDTYVHGLDLAVATGQEDKVDPEMAETALALAKEMGLDKFRMPGVFGPEVPCAETTTPHRRLLAFLGRDVE